MVQYMFMLEWTKVYISKSKSAATNHIHPQESMDFIKQNDEINLLITFMIV